MQQSVVVNFKSLVFLNHTRNTYLLVGDGIKYNHFLTMEKGMIEVKRVPKNSQFMKELIPYNKYSLKHAAHIYLTSFLEKTPVAVKALQAILRNKDNSRMNFLPASAAEKAEIPTRIERAQEKANELTLEQICGDLKLDPKRVRGWFRENNVQKPGQRWTWPKSQRDQIIKLIKSLEPK
jgi:hypothetical protein